MILSAQFCGILRENIGAQRVRCENNKNKHSFGRRKTMKTTKMLAILVLALGLMVCWPKTASADEPMGSAFTYQGHLYDNNDVADGEYDFQFQLWGDPCSSEPLFKIGDDVNKPDVDVIDSYFTVELDFGGGVFDGNAVWLAIGVRPGVENDPCSYEVLLPRQEVTPTPYAIYAEATGTVPVPLELSSSVAFPGAVIKGTNNGNGFGVKGIHTTSGNTGNLGTISSGVYGFSSAGRAVFGSSGSGYAGYFDGKAKVIGDLIVDSNVGIGTTSPGEKLDVAGTGQMTGFKLPTGASSGYVLTSDGSGVGTWQAAAGGGDSDWMVSGNDMYSIPSGNVGIGATSPDEKLHVQGSGYEKIKVESTVSWGSATVSLNTNGGTFDYLQLYKGGPSTNGDIAGIPLANLSQVNAGANAGPLMLRVITSNPMYFLTSNQERMRITADGNVGIGTTSPSHELNVVGDANITGSLYAGSGSTVLFVDDATDRVGIGTTSPSFKLDVEGSARFWNSTGSRSGVQIGTTIGSGTAIEGIASDGNLTMPIYINYDSSGKVILAYGGGNVGIGETSPTAKLHIGGTAGVDGIKFPDGTLQTTAAAGGEWTISDSNMYTGAGVTGNVGIGTTSPDKKLTVVGSIKASTSVATGSAVYGRHDGAGKGGEFWGAIGVFGSGTDTGGKFQSPGGGVAVKGFVGLGSGTGVEGWGPGGGFDFYAAGPGTNYGAASSIRWKSDVRPIDDPLGKLLRLRGVYFNWDKEHGGHHDVGMIAEEVGEVLPEIVQYEENGIDASGMDYGQLTPLLVEAVKELKTEVDKLRKENTDLRNRLEAIEKMPTRSFGLPEGGQR